MYDAPNALRNNRQQLDPGAQVGAQVAKRPLFALAAAVAAGYLLGSLDTQEQRATGQRASGNTYSRSRQYRASPQGTSDLFAPVRDEIDLIQSAAMAVAKQKLQDLTHGRWDQLLQFGNASQVDRGLVDPNAGREYTKTYHSPDERQEI